MPSPPWTDREDRIIASKLDYPSLSYDELRTALRAIGHARTIKGIEHRLQVLRVRREAPRSGWLSDPFLTRRNKRERHY